MEPDIVKIGKTLLVPRCKLANGTCIREYRYQSKTYSLRDIVIIS